MRRGRWRNRHKRFRQLQTANFNRIALSYPLTDGFFWTEIQYNRIKDLYQRGKSIEKWRRKTTGATGFLTMPASC
ncbi:hypothetical protein HMPREF3213_01231 [Heyndrickxia coagulans]|uniref:Uncharacterized protein n=1 Tax=Heyndrickxia coagulans TaxID=1398 RepID=A0A133KVJ9_HEYCO|nr:hypothetical protein HMPREF3213_01231 [Heyndrickxia coagulans]